MTDKLNLDIVKHTDAQLFLDAVILVLPSLTKEKQTYFIDDKKFGKSFDALIKYVIKLMLSYNLSPEEVEYYEFLENLSQKNRTDRTKRSFSKALTEFVPQRDVATIISNNQLLSPSQEEHNLRFTFQLRREKVDYIEKRTFHHPDGMIEIREGEKGVETITVTISVEIEKLTKLISSSPNSLIKDNQQLLIEGFTHPPKGFSWGRRNKNPNEVREFDAREAHYLITSHAKDKIKEVETDEFSYQKTERIIKGYTQDPEIMTSSLFTSLCCKLEEIDEIENLIGEGIENEIFDLGNNDFKIITPKTSAVGRWFGSRFKLSSCQKLKPLEKRYVCLKLGSKILNQIFNTSDIKSMIHQLDDCANCIVDDPSLFGLRM